MSNTKKYKERINDGLTKALNQAREEGIQQLDIMKDKLIIFSDLHKGARNGADDFLVCERAYNAALAYYYNEGYTLVSLGDVEELWEERPQPVLNAYKHTLSLEAKFHQADRLIRIWGNHDDIWRYPAEVEKHLEKVLDKKPLKVRESLLLQVVKDDNTLGSMLLLHGHQGTLDSERFSSISKLLVRYLWRPFQRLTNISLNTPAKDWQLRQGHNAAMFQWSERHEKLVLIAGHTHRPVFKSQPHETKLRNSLDEARKEAAANDSDPQLREKVSKLAAELEWVLAQQQQVPQASKRLEFNKPSYFNTGCCSYSDGDITGIEISAGHIRLVRWPNENDEPLPINLECADLEAEIFAKC